MTDDQARTHCENWKDNYDWWKLAFMIGVSVGFTLGFAFHLILEP